MVTFEWSALFETGLPEIDVQHRRLVDLLNQLGQDVHSADPDHATQTLNALAEYTVYHFGSEERAMEEAGIAPAHTVHHRGAHASFVAQVTQWIQRRAAGEAIDLQQLLSFLSNWLIGHILGEDQALGRQVRAIQSGVDPEQACAQDRSSDDPRTDILLHALRRLYFGLVERNEDLVQTQKALAKLNATLEQRVDERTADLVQAHEQLAQEQERLLHAENMASLGRMVAGFAHEVNTPIGVAVGASSQARDVVGEIERMVSAEEVDEDVLKGRLDLLRETSELSLRSLSRASDLVKSFKRTAVDRGSEAERTYDLAETLDDVCKTVAMLFKGGKVKLEVDCPSGIELYGPVGALEQVITNLLQNSLVHGFANGTREGAVRLSAERDAQTVRIVCADNGAGMDANTLAHAFEPFFTTQRGSGGSGLGLYMAYNLVTQALHGEIQGESEVGGGARFVIEYPVEAPKRESKHHEDRSQESAVHA